MEQPTISHPTDRPNYTEVTVGPVDLIFSYRTVIAFRGPGEPSYVVTVNAWGPTTGKHLNYCPGDKVNRVPRDEFCARLDAMLARLNMTVDA